MGKNTNILDLNNRLEKVEKENVAQNSYTSLKNKPKINNVTLNGNKSSSDLGLAAAGDITDINTAIGDMSELETTATNLVGAINEVNSAVNTLNRGSIFYYPVVSVNNFAAITLPKANSYTISSISIFGGDQEIPEATEGVTDGYRIGWVSTEAGYLVLELVGTYANVNVGKILSVNVIIQ